jgi:hypothetical protein
MFRNYFKIAGLVIGMVTTMVTVLAILAFRAAVANPVNSLRLE